ncbi:hypothetical protein [Sulfurimonas sp.]|jgi:hypothetical protein|uniref:hypothetical protein n=1 Tax=Sulfurimonas sp. TaxID=2022749 RepID=UPI00260118DE|nr:hypothetical protein [Sulfurimonas sp.]MBT5934416.1 hypothetical protein [Sulfurimonas sp.]
MTLGFKIKHYFFSAFREFFVHHHGSLEFRAKICALVIAADDNVREEYFLIVKSIGLHIYNDDDERSDLLILSTQELVKKVKDNNGLDIDSLVKSIQNELKIIPRYAKKIDIQVLTPLLTISKDADILSYQNNILEFLQNLKDEIL